MLSAVLTWLSAGSPPHYAYFAVAAYALLEYVLPRVKMIRANSTLEAIFNGLAALLVRMVPLVGKFVAVLGTPDPQPAPVVPIDPTKPLPSKGGLSLVPLLLFAGLAAGMSSCASTPTDIARQSLTAAEKFETSTAGALSEFDKEQQQRIIDRAVAECSHVDAGAPHDAAPSDGGAPSAADRFEACKMNVGVAALESYRAKRNKVVALELGLQGVIATGYALVPLVEQGLKPQADLSAWIGQLTAALSKLTDAYAAFQAASNPSRPSADGGAPHVPDLARSPDLSLPQPDTTTPGAQRPATDQFPPRVDYDAGAR